MLRFWQYIVLAIAISALPCRGQGLLLNEFLYQNSMFPDSEGGFSAWVEVINNGSGNVDLSGYRISVDTVTDVFVQLPGRTIMPGETAVIYFSAKNKSGHSAFHFPADGRYLVLYDEHGVVDRLRMAFLPNPNESIGRNPQVTGEWIHFRSDQVSPGGVNYAPMLWKKITNTTAFQPRDSSPNAVLVYDNKIWVLAGYRYTGTEWKSLSDVWCSSDGIHWELKNPAPPFDAYSAFVVFQGKMWAFDGRGCFSSTDGVTWVNESPRGFPGGFGARVAIHNDELYFCNGAIIGKSSDGIHWETILTGLPWEGIRAWPSFVEHNGKLFFFGGGVNHSTGNDYYYNDVWSSADGVHWELITGEAQWPGRFWCTSFSFDNKLWIMGGWKYHDRANAEWGNRRDIWVSENGKDWFEFKSGEIWPNRHSPLSWIKDGRLYLSSGYGGGGLARMYNDIWVCEKKQDRFSFFNDEIVETLTYGDSVILTTDSEISFEVDDPAVLKLEGSKLVAMNTGFANLRVSAGADAVHYPLAGAKKVVVTQRDLHLVASDTSRRYGDENPVFTYKVNGLAFKDALTSAPTLQSGTGGLSDAGVYPITITGGSASDNYRINRVNAELTITPRPLKIVVNDRAKSFGEINPDFGFTLEGALPQDMTLITGSLSLATDADQYAPPGDYEIRASGDLLNYDEEFHNGTLRIREEDVVMCFPNPVDRGEEFHIVVPFNLSESDYLHVMNTQGQTIHRLQFSDSNHFAIDTQTPPGVYSFMIKNRGRVYRGKFIVK